MARLRAQTLEIAEDVKQGLLSADRDKKVARMVEHFLDKGLRMKEIKGSDALGAAKMYADRRWPVQQAAPEGPRISFVQINVDVARLDMGAHPTTICCVENEGKNEKDEKPL